MLTGKGIHEAAIEISKGEFALMDWDQLRSKTREQYNAVAERLNAQLVQAGEEDRKIDFSLEMVQLLLDEAMIKGIEKLLLHPEQEYTEELIVMYLLDTLNLVANVLPDEMRSSVRRIVVLYKQFTKEQ